MSSNERVCSQVSSREGWHAIDIFRTLIWFDFDDLKYFLNTWRYSGLISHKGYSLKLRGGAVASTTANYFTHFGIPTLDVMSILSNIIQSIRTIIIQKMHVHGPLRIRCQWLMLLFSMIDDEILLILGCEHLLGIWINRYPISWCIPIVSTWRHMWVVLHREWVVISFFNDE